MGLREILLVGTMFLTASSVEPMIVPSPSGIENLFSSIKPTSDGILSLNDGLVMTVYSMPDSTPGISFISRQNGKKSLMYNLVLMGVTMDNRFLFSPVEVYADIDQNGRFDWYERRRFYPTEELKRQIPNEKGIISLREGIVANFYPASENNPPGVFLGPLDNNGGPDRIYDISLMPIIPDVFLLVPQRVYTDFDGDKNVDEVKNYYE